MVLGRWCLLHARVTSAAVAITPTTATRTEAVTAMMAVGLLDESTLSEYASADRIDLLLPPKWAVEKQSIALYQCEHLFIWVWVNVECAAIYTMFLLPGAYSVIVPSVMRAEAGQAISGTIDCNAASSESSLLSDWTVTTRCVLGVGYGKLMNFSTHTAVHILLDPHWWRNYWVLRLTGLCCILMIPH